MGAVRRDQVFSSWYDMTSRIVGKAEARPSHMENSGKDAGWKVEWRRREVLGRGPTELKQKDGKRTSLEEEK